MKNPKIGDRVINKEGLHDPGRIYGINADGTVKVQWHYQDGSYENSEKVNPKELTRVKPTVCEKCGRPL